MAAMSSAAGQSKTEGGHTRWVQLVVGIIGMVAIANL